MRLGNCMDGYDERISKKIDTHKAIHLLKFIFNHKPKKKNDKLSISFYGGRATLEYDVYRTNCRTF